MADTDLHAREADAPEEAVQGEGEQFDEENRLKPEFVKAVRESLRDDNEDST